MRVTNPSADVLELTDHLHFDDATENSVKVALDLAAKPVEYYFTNVPPDHDINVESPKECQGTVQLKELGNGESTNGYVVGPTTLHSFPAPAQRSMLSSNDDQTRMALQLYDATELA